jgi:TonB family protein
MRKSQEADMLNTLIESRSRRKRNASGTFVAITAHALIIGGAAYATATAATTPDATPTEVVKIYSPRSKPHAAPHKASSRATAKAQQTVNVPRISVNVSPNLPPLDIPLADPSAGAASDFPVSTSATSDVPSPAAEPSAYDAAEVESQVAVVSGFRPQYPASLRAAGMEGRVVAQFIVTADGRTDPASIRILSATNDQFGESVRQALLKSKFRAARIGSKNVAQLVQQLFVFKLDR